MQSRPLGKTLAGQLGALLSQQVSLILASRSGRIVSVLRLAKKRKLRTGAIARLLRPGRAHNNTRAGL